MAMIRKKRWACKTCNIPYLKWQGICTKCKVGGTIIEVVPAPVRAKATPLQRQKAPVDPNKRIRRRSKDSERSIAKRMVAADGPDPSYKNIASSTGRVGHITNMRFDAVSRTYITENKNRKLPSWMITAWIVLNQRGIDFSKNVLLHIDPPNMPKDIQINGTKAHLDTMSIITQSRHEELIVSEKLLADVLLAVEGFKEYSDLQEICLNLQSQSQHKA